MANPPFASAWAAQWKAADLALAEVRQRELSTLTDAEGLAASEALLHLADPKTMPKTRRRNSGLVEQQRLFTSARRTP